jgi:hypothetical protein
MTESRLFFLALSGLLIIPSIIIYHLAPRLAVGIVIGLAVLFTPISISMGADFSMSQQIIQGIVGAMAIGGTILPILLGQPTLLASYWKMAGAFARIGAVLFLGMLATATVLTWLDGTPAAGIAVSFMVWPLALVEIVGSARNPKPETIPHMFFFWASLIALVFIGVSGFTLDSFGQYDVVLGVLSLSLFGMALGEKSGTRWLFIGLAVVGWIALSFLAPAAQSVSIGIFLGGMWMLVLKLIQPSRFILQGRIALLALSTIFVGPLIAILTFISGQSSGFLSDLSTFAVSQVNESEMNLLDRPARWAALWQAILDEPFRLKFTNFLDTEYVQYAGLYGTIWEDAQPHNILIALGRYIGLPGMALGFVALFLLVRATVGITLSNKKTSQYENALVASGLIIGLLFRNMWSLKLFVEPVEIVFFALAVFVLLNINLTQFKTNQAV